MKTLNTTCPLLPCPASFCKSDRASPLAPPRPAPPGPATACHCWPAHLTAQPVNRRLKLSFCVSRQCAIARLPPPPPSPCFCVTLETSEPLVERGAGTSGLVEMRLVHGAQSHINGHVPSRRSLFPVSPPPALEYQPETPACIQTISPPPAPTPLLPRS